MHYLLKWRVDNTPEELYASVDALVAFSHYYNEVTKKITKYRGKT